MPVTEPVLCKRIPTPPWGDPKDRHVVGYDEYVKTGGYQALEKALALKPAAVVDLIKDSQLRGRGGPGFPCGPEGGFLPEPGEGGPASEGCAAPARLGEIVDGHDQLASAAVEGGRGSCLGGEDDAGDPPVQHGFHTPFPEHRLEEIQPV